MLNDKLSELEYDFKLMQDEGVGDWEAGSAEWEADEGRVLGDRRERLAEITDELRDLSDVLSSKEVEVAKLQRDKVKIERVNAQLLKAKEELEADLVEVRKEQSTIKKKFSSLAAVKEEVDKVRHSAEKSLSSLESEKKLLLKEIGKLEGNLHSAKSANVASKAYAPADKLLQTNKKLEAENATYSAKIKELKEELARTQEMYEEKLSLLSCHKKTQQVYKNYKSADKSKEHKDPPTQAERAMPKKVAQENTKAEIAKAFHRVDRNVMPDASKVLSAKKELERIKSAHSKLLENRQKINEELSALKQHTELLKTHNLKLHDELDKLHTKSKQGEVKHSRNKVEKQFYNAKRWGTQPAQSENVETGS